MWEIWCDLYGHKSNNSGLRFPSDKYRIWVQTDTSLSKVPYVYISSQKDNWELKVHIETCEIIGVINKGDKESDNPKQILEDLLTPTLHKSPCKNLARQADRRFALWASSCRRLTPSAYLYSLRSDNEKRSGDLSLLPPRISEIPQFFHRRQGSVLYHCHITTQPLRRVAVKLWGSKPTKLLKRMRK